MTSSERRTDKRSSAQTLARGLAALEALAEAGVVGVAELARRLGLSKTVAHRLLRTLRERQYVTQDATGRYRLTWRLFTLGASIPQRSGLHQLAQPVLERLVAATGETTNVGVLDGTHMIYVQKVESPEPLRIDVPAGRRVPAYCTALGKAILAALPDAERSGVLERIDFTAHDGATPQTLRSLDALARDLDRTRERGWAVDNEEYARGVRCVAAAVPGPGGLPVAGLSVSGPATRMTRARADEVGPVVREAATRLGEDAARDGR